MRVGHGHQMMTATTSRDFLILDDYAYKIRIFIGKNIVFLRFFLAQNPTLL